MKNLDIQTIKQELKEYFKDSGYEKYESQLEEMTEEEIRNLYDLLPKDNDIVNVTDIVDTSPEYKQMLGEVFKVDKKYEDAKWILKKAVEIGYDCGGDKICLSDGGELMFIAFGDTGFLHCCTNVQMIQEYWEDIKDQDIQNIIGNLTKWQYFDDCEGMEEYEWDDELSDKENKKAEEKWYDKQTEEHGKERDEWMKSFNNQWRAALEEKFGEEAKNMIEYPTLY